MAVHIRSERQPERAYCGIAWAGVRGGNLASNTLPVVSGETAGSGNAVTCRTCLAVWRRRQLWAQG
jgi:hypothetical protein